MASPGMEILFQSVQNQFKCKEDSIVCALHWCLISSKFKCIGIGEEVPKDRPLKKSEALPRDWNANSDYYTLLYQPASSDVIVLLKVVKMDDSLLIHAMRMKDSQVASINICTNDYCSDNYTDFDQAYKDLDKLVTVFQKDVLTEMSATKDQATSPAPERTERRENLRHRYEDDPLRIPPRNITNPYADLGEHNDPLIIGRGDLDPLAGGMGGGMVMDPFRGGHGRGMMPDYGEGMPGRLPRGAVPPGARFDPFGPGQPGRAGGIPPGSGSQAGPDPDHLPPPGYDDMFM